jgi:probable HAF family extracellular repeat protein
MQASKRLSLCLLTLSMAVANAWAHPEYRVTIVGPLNSEPTAMNNAGVVTGIVPTGPGITRPFVNRGTGAVLLGTLGGTSADARGINDKGQVIGTWLTTGGQYRGYVYYHGRQRDIGVINGGSTFYRDINNAGYILAISGSRSYLRAPNGSLRDLGTLPGENPVNQAEALNNLNQVAGESGAFLSPEPPLRAYIWTKGVLRDLGDFGFTPNYALDINDRGQATGYASLPYGFRNQVAFIYSNGRLIDIDGRPANVNKFSTGDAINNYGHVVGYADHLGAYVYRGRRMESLNALVDPRLGWNIQFPRAINDAGQIAATGIRNGKSYAVRLDLIRPHLQTLPPLQGDDAATVAAQAVSPAEAKAEAEAQAKEVVQPVGQ